MVKLLSILLFIVVTHSNEISFTGTWDLVDQQNISGNLYSNGVPKQMVIIQRSDSIIIKRLSTDQSGDDIIAIDSISFEGRPFETISISKRKKFVSANWNNKKDELTVTGKFYNLTDLTRLEYIITDTWALEGGSLSMVRVNKNLINDEEWESRSIYEKRK